MTRMNDDEEPGSRPARGSSDSVELFKQEINRTFAAAQLPPLEPQTRPPTQAGQPTTEVPDARALGIVPAPWLTGPTSQPSGPGAPDALVRGTRVTGQRALTFGVALVAILVAASVIAYFATTSGSKHDASTGALSQVSQSEAGVSSQADAGSAPAQSDPSVASDAGIATDQPGGEDPTTGPSAVHTNSTDDVVSSLDGLLDDSTNARSGVQPALDDIQQCAADDSDISALQNAADVRRTLLTNLDSLDFVDMRGGPALRAALVRALTASINADESYVDWGNDQLGCTGSANSDSGKQAGDRYSKAATKAKVAFLKLWNPLAERHGYSAREQGDISCVRLHGLG